MEVSKIEKNTKEKFSVGLICISVIVIAIEIVFLPLVLSSLEAFLFHTHYVEEMFKRIGLHDELGSIYSTIIRYFAQIFGSNFFRR